MAASEAAIATVPDQFVPNLAGQFALVVGLAVCLLVIRSALLVVAVAAAPIQPELRLAVTVADLERFLTLQEVALLHQVLDAVVLDQCCSAYRILECSHW